MRAYMSDTTRRGPLGCRHLGMLAPREAEREARAILAESEPGVGTGDSKTWWGSVSARYVGDVPYPTRRDPAYAALAESLRSFVEAA